MVYFELVSGVSQDMLLISSINGDLLTIVDTDILYCGFVIGSEQ